MATENGVRVNGAAPAANGAVPSADRPAEAAPPPPAPHTRPRLETLGRALAGRLRRELRDPHLRTGAAGVLLVLLGAVFVTDSVWSLLLIVAGAFAIASAWLGPRVEGGLHLDFGRDGASFELRTRIVPAARAAPAAAALPAPGPAPAAPAPDPAVPDADVVEGEAHTMEIDVEELKALIAAAEQRERGAA